MPQEADRLAETAASDFRNARFSFLRNQRAAASFSIHSASSFTLNPYRGLYIAGSFIEIQTSTHNYQFP
jgi:hypothetical protein